MGDIVSSVLSYNRSPTQQQQQQQQQMWCSEPLSNIAAIESVYDTTFTSAQTSMCFRSDSIWASMQMYQKTNTKCYVSYPAPYFILCLFLWWKVLKRGKSVQHQQQQMQLADITFSGHFRKRLNRRRLPILFTFHWLSSQPFTQSPPMWLPPRFASGVICLRQFNCCEPSHCFTSGV